MILLPRAERQAASQVAERVRCGVEALEIVLPQSGDAKRLRVTVSLGVATFPDEANDAASLLQGADEAMYTAKQSGRNSLVVFGQDRPARPAQSRVLLVDDEEKNLRLLEAYLSPDGYEILKARDGEEALQLARRCRPDIILLDVMMPRLSGFDVCRRLKRENDTRLIPVVLVTALSDRADWLRGIEAGADEFLSKPVNCEELSTRVRTSLRLKRNTDLLEDAETVIFTLARAVEARDPSTGGHVERVSHYAAELGKAIGLPDTQVQALRHAGVIHDIGKIAVPDAVLLKPGKLTTDEKQIIERHVEVGYELLRPLRTFAESLPAVRFHHERLDGSGYPLALRGAQVPVIAQVLAIVDVYDALTTNRVYRPALRQAEASQILRAEAARGMHDPNLVETFIQLVTTTT